jgi:hypothetical protein
VVNCQRFYIYLCRYFIVVDDTWDVKVWDVINFAFLMGGYGYMDTYFGMHGVVKFVT